MHRDNSCKMLPNDTIISMKNIIKKHASNPSILKKKIQTTNPNTFESQEDFDEDEIKEDYDW